MAYETFFAFDLNSGKVCEYPAEDTLGEYMIRYERHDHGNLVTIGDGLRHTIWLQDYHWDRLLRIIKNDELDKSGLDMLINGWLDSGFPDEDSKRVFVSAVRSGRIKPIGTSLQSSSSIKQD